MGLFKKTKDDDKDEVIVTREKSAQEWYPLQDIEDSYMYMKDKNVISAIEVKPINIELLTEKELRRLINCFRIVYDRIQMKENMQIFCVGKNIDLTSHINKLEEHKNNSEDMISRKVIQMYINQAIKLSSEGEVTERKFFILFCDKYNKYSKENLSKKSQEIIKDIEDCGMKARALTELQLIELQKMFSHPSTSSFNQVEYNPIPPLLKE